MSSLFENLSATDLAMQLTASFAYEFKVLPLCSPFFLPNYVCEISQNFTQPTPQPPRIYALFKKFVAFTVCALFVIA